MSGPTVSAHGLALSPPPGWETAIYRRSPGPGETTAAVLHAATVPLPAVRGDYGGGLVETLGPEDVFVALLEFGREEAAAPLFAASGIPGLTGDLYRPRALQRVIAGQAGVQRFFNVKSRAFCLYSVVGAFANRGSLAYRANHLIGSLRIAEGP